MHLAGQLGADGSAGAGDQDAPSGQVVGDVPEVGVDRMPAEDVGDVDLTDAAEVDPAADHLRDGRQGQELQARLTDLVLELAHEITGRGGDREDHGVCVQVVGGADESAVVADHGDAMEAKVSFGGVVVDQADDEVLGVALGAEQRQQLVSRVAGAVHEGALDPLLVAGRVAVAEGAEQPPAGRGADEGDGRDQHRDASRQRGVQHREQGRGGQAHGRELHSQTRHLVERPDTEPTAVELREVAEGDEHHHRDREIAQGRTPLDVTDREVETNPEDDRGGQGPAARIPEGESATPGDRDVPEGQRAERRAHVVPRRAMAEQRSARGLATAPMTILPLTVSVPGHSTAAR